MSDTLTQLQNALDQLLIQMYTSVMYIDSNAEMARIDGQPFNPGASNTQGDGGSAVTSTIATVAGSAMDGRYAKLGSGNDNGGTVDQEGHVTGQQHLTTIQTSNEQTRWTGVNDLGQIQRGGGEETLLKTGKDELREGGGGIKANDSTWNEMVNSVAVGEEESVGEDSVTKTLGVLSRDIVSKVEQILGMIDRLPSLGQSENDQRKRIQELEEKLQQVNEEHVKAHARWSDLCDKVRKALQGISDEMDTLRKA